jgi:hypothetical protein
VARPVRNEPSTHAGRPAEQRLRSGAARSQAPVALRRSTSSSRSQS